MAGLNDDVDEGLPPEEIPEIEKPNSNPKQPITRPVSLVAINNKIPSRERLPTATDLFGKGLIPGELPNLNANITIIQEESNRVDDLKAKLESLKEKRSISQEDARVLDSIAPGFISEERPIGLFSKEDTRTNYAESIKTTEQIIAESGERVASNFVAYVESLIISIDAFETKFNTTYRETLNNQIATLTSSVSENILETTVKKYYKFFSYSIDELSPEDFNVFDENAGIKEWTEVIGYLQKAIKFKPLVTYIVNKDITLVESLATAQLGVEEKSPTFNDLLGGADKIIEKAVEEISEEMYNIKNRLVKLLDEFRAIGDNKDTILNFVKRKDVEQATHQSSVNNLSQFTLWLMVLLETAMSILLLSKIKQE